MYTNTTPEPKDSGTTDDQDETTDCACTPLLACWQHYHNGDRGRPAIRRVN